MIWKSTGACPSIVKVALRSVVMDSSLYRCWLLLQCQNSDQFA
jgi:hypothetical protein